MLVMRSYTLGVKSVIYDCFVFIVGKTPAKRQCTGCKDGAASSVKITASMDSRIKSTAKVLPLMKDAAAEESTSATCQPSSSSSTRASHSSSCSSCSSSVSEEDENDEDAEQPSTATTSSAHPANLLAIVKEKPTMSDMVMKTVESIFRLLNKQVASP